MECCVATLVVLAVSYTHLDALALSSAQLVGELREHLPSGNKPDGFEHALCLCLALPGVQLRPVQLDTTDDAV